MTYYKGLMGAFLLALMGLSFADNNCGVNCTQTIATSIATNIAINAANDAVNNQTAAIAETVANQVIDNRVFEKFAIWAENASGNIAGGGSDDWAFGDSAAGIIGLALPEDWEIYAVSFSADVFPIAATATINVLNSIDPGPSTILTFTANNSSNTARFFEILNTPVPVPAGTVIGFQTASVAGGTISDARVAVWLRRHPD